MTPLPIWPTDLARKRNNQRIIAEVQRWPIGALQTCADLEDRHPGWHVSWMPANITPGWERPAGFYASHPTDGHVVKKVDAFAGTVEGLEPLLIEVPEHDWSVRGCEWCRARL